MNQDQKSNDGFEDRLLAELRARVATREVEEGALPDPPPRRRVPRLAFAGAAVTAVAATVLIVGAGGGDTPAAFAVTPQGDGSVDVEVRALKDPQGLEEALDAAGVKAEVTYSPQGEGCSLSRLQPSGAESARPSSAESVPAEAAEAVPVETVPAEAAPAPPAGRVALTVSRLTIDPAQVGKGRTLIVVAAPAKDGKGEAVEATVAAESSAAICAASTPAETVPAQATEVAAPGVPAEAAGR